MFYKHLAPTERIMIQEYLSQGLKISEIAKKLNRHYSTLYRELKRNSVRKDNARHMYNALNAETKYLNNKSKKPYKLNSKIKDLITSKLRLTWPPEQISAKIKTKNANFPCFKTIYNWLYLGFLPKIKANNLRHKGKSLKRKANFKIAEMNKRSIWKRHKIIKNRERIGDWEIDTIVSGHGGSKACLLTIVDRKLWFIIAKKLENRLSENVLEILLKTLKQEKVYSITSDRGNEFYHFRAVETALNIQYYFANPYCSW